jgi:hypothetical protein
MDNSLIRVGGGDVVPKLLFPTRITASTLVQDPELELDPAYLRKAS